MQVEDLGVTVLAVHCRQLTFLGLHCCRALTVRAAGGLPPPTCARCPQHQRLPEAVGGAVQALIDGNPGLHTCARRRNVIVGGCLRLLGARCRCIRG